MINSVPVLGKQESASSIRTSEPSKKSRPLTPKITESRAPDAKQSKKYFVRHHLDDQQMKEALSHNSFEEPST